jgi:hypothetical protein
MAVARGEPRAAGIRCGKLAGQHPNHANVPTVDDRGRQRDGRGKTEFLRFSGLCPFVNRGACFDSGFHHHSNPGKVLSECFVRIHD